MHVTPPVLRYHKRSFSDLLDGSDSTCEYPNKRSNFDLDLHSASLDHKLSSPQAQVSSRGKDLIYLTTAGFKFFTPLF